MKLWLCFVLVLLCSALVLSQRPPGDRPHYKPVPTTTPQRPYGQGPTSTPVKPTNEPTEDPDVLVCTMNLVTCPDGTFAHQDKYCRQICGIEPLGGQYNQSYVSKVRSELLEAYGSEVINFITTNSLKYESNVKIHSPESLTDLCLDVQLQNAYVFTASSMPNVYRGVRLFYVNNPDSCPMTICADGTMINCNEMCDDMDEESFFLLPIAIMAAVVFLSACCCCCCARQRRNRCNQKGLGSSQYSLIETPSSQPIVMVPYTEDSYYPSEQYEHLQNQTPAPVSETAIPMMQPMFYPPMPPMHHQMFPNGAYPVMMQAPNGMWYPVVPQHENV